MKRPTSYYCVSSYTHLQQMPRTRYVREYSSFLLPSFDCPPSALFMFFFFTNRNLTTCHPQRTHSTAQGNAISPLHYIVALGVIKKLHQSMGLFFLRPSCIPPCASAAGGISRPRSGVLVLRTAQSPSTVCHLTITSCYYVMMKFDIMLPRDAASSVYNTM